MNRTSLRRIAAPGIAALALGMTLSACGAANEDSASSDSSNASSESLSGDLAGAGASSQEKAQEAWSTGFQGANSGVTLTYDPVGSGDGRKQFIAKGVSFAGSDSYLNDDEGELSAAKERCGGQDPIEVPAYVSPIAVVYNLEGVDSLQLSAKTIAQIFDNKITKWNDPAIADENPDADLPDTAITPVHRSDDSGTTKNFTDYLGKAGEGAWKYDAEDAFPVKGEAAEGTSGVISAVTKGKGTIGYADESQAGDLGQVKVKVGEEYRRARAPRARPRWSTTSPAAEGPRRRRHGRRHRPDHHRGRRLPGRAAVLPDRLPDLRRRQRGRPGQGLPRLHRLGARARLPQPRTPARHRSTPRCRQGQGHRRKDQGQQLIAQAR